MNALGHFIVTHRRVIAMKFALACALTAAHYNPDLPLLSLIANISWLIAL